MEARPMDEILPFLFVGCEGAAEDVNLLVSHHVSYVLTVSDRLPAAASRYPPHFAVYHVPLSDFGETPLEHVTEDCFAFINTARDADAKVLVHCQVGVNRSPSIVIAYLMKHRFCNLLKGCKEVKERRPVVYPVEGYLRQLLEYELRLFCHNSCTLEDLQAVMKGGCVNMFQFPSFQNYQQHGFGSESETNSDDEQPEFGAEPLCAMPATQLLSMPFNLMGGSATSSVPGLPNSTGLGDLQFHCRFISPRGEEEARHSSSAPTSPHQSSPYGLALPSSPYHSPLVHTAVHHSQHHRPGAMQPPYVGRRGVLVRGTEQSPILSPAQLSPQHYASLYSPALRPTRSASLCDSPSAHPCCLYPSYNPPARNSYSCSPTARSPTGKLPLQMLPPLPLVADVGSPSPQSGLGSQSLRRSPSPTAEPTADRCFSNHGFCVEHEGEPAMAAAGAGATAADVKQWPGSLQWVPRH